MTESGWTAGPWEACDIGDYSDFDGNSRVILGDDRRIAVVHCTPGDSVSEANARLIAAAPEMHRVLAIGERFLDKCNACWAAGEPRHRVEDMLAHAERFRAALKALGEGKQ